MNWGIEFTRPARRQFEALGASERKRIAVFLSDRVANHPEPKALARRLVGQEELWRFRVGDYRIIVRFEDDRLVVLVVAIGHRATVYR
jgi:mRNA interferase RelE/StbE